MWPPDPSNVQGSDECPWQSSMPRETLLHVFLMLPQKDRALTVAGVCRWWRQVALESALLPELNLCSVPLFAQRSQHLAGFEQQADSFLCWLERRAAHVRFCILQAERWEAFLHAQDEGGSLQLRVATAALLAPHLHSLKLVSSQGGGRATSAFLQQGGRLQELSIDFWGSGNALPRQLACCTSLQRLQLQCSSRLGGYGSLGALTGLRELAVVDSDWAAIPAEVAGLPRLKKLLLRYADFESGSWLPGSEPTPLPWRDLTLHACQISALPPSFSRLAALTALRLDRNGSLGELPAGALCHLSRLSLLSLEGCRSLVSLGEAVPELPLQSLNLQESGVLQLPPGHFNSTLTELYWSPVRIAAQPPQDTPIWQVFVPQLPPPHLSSEQRQELSQGVLEVLPGIHCLSSLRALYLAGTLPHELARRWAEELFRTLPELQKVCLQQVGWVAQRQGPGVVADG